MNTEFDGLRSARFTFDDSPCFEGFTDDSRWNGFLNVWVTSETHTQVREWLGEDDWHESGFDEIEPDARGLYSYAHAFATSEVKERPFRTYLYPDSALRTMPVTAEDTEIFKRLSSPLLSVSAFDSDAKDASIMGRLTFDSLAKVQS